MTCDDVDFADSLRCIWKYLENKKVLTVQGRLDTATGGMEGKLALKKKVSPGTTLPPLLATMAFFLTCVLAAFVIFSLSLSLSLSQFFPEAGNPWYTRADVGASYESNTDEVSQSINQFW